MSEYNGSGELNARIEELEQKLDKTSVYEMLFKNSKDLVCIAGSDGFFKLVSPSFTRLLGYSEEELLSNPFSTFIHPDDLIRTNNEYDGNLEGVSNSNFENRYITKDGRVVTLQWMSTPEPDKGIIYAIARDVTEQREMELQLKSKQELLEASQTVARLGNFSFNTKDYSLYWSDELYNIFGISDEERKSLLEAYISRFDKEGMELYNKIVEDSLRTGEKYAFQHKVHIPGGPVKIVSCIGIPFVNDQGEVYRIDGVVQDITEQIEQESIILKSVKEKEFLIKELHHRVKNNLQVISSLISLQTNLVKAENVQHHYLKECQNRIKSMASIHDMLYRSEDISSINFSNYVEQLVSDLVRSHLGSNNDLKIEFSTDDISLPLDTAVPLGLLINEVVTNSLKHAFNTDRKAELNVQMKKEGEIFLVKICDNGIGFDPNAIDRENSIGLMIIETLGEQLESRSVLDSSDSGTCYTIELKNE